MTDQDRQSELDVRAATQRGEAGDRIPGFDPAAAPMETDAEAGGESLDGIRAGRSHPAQRPPETSTGTAMRPTLGARLVPPHARSGSIVPAGLGLLVVILLAVVVGPLLIW